MSFPTSPSNNDITTINGIKYIYNSSKQTWTRQTVSIVGAQGAQGYQGVQGSVGTQGFQGVQGAYGISQFVGTQGSATATGGSITFASSYGEVINGSGNTITFNTPQDIRTTASPSFAAIIVNTQTNVTSNTFTTSSTSQVSVDSFSAATYRSAKYQVQMTSGTSYHTIELLLIHDGTTVYLTQYGEIFSGSSLGSFDASISAGVLNLLFTATNAVTIVKLSRYSIVV